MGGPEKIADLLAEVTKIGEMQLDDNVIDMLKYQIRTNPYHRAVQMALIDHKEKVGVSSKPIKLDEDAHDEERLNNMLRAEGIATPGDASAPVDVKGDGEYNKELLKVQTEFTQSMNFCQKNKVEFTDAVTKIVRSQGEFRPISHSALEILSSSVASKFQKLAIAIKQRTCERVTDLRKVFMDARRTRKNFSQQATVILNNYFQDHLTHPYPSEQEKEMLARQCNISVAQVCNWFGNKRIRYKKLMKKGQHEDVGKKEVCMPGTPGYSPYQTPSPYQFGFPMPNPYLMPTQPFPMGAPYFFPPANMSQYQNIPSGTPNRETPATPMTSTSE